MHINIKTLLPIALLYATLGHAQNNPIAYATDARIKHVTYHDNDVIPIQATGLINTQIIFDRDEKIINIEGGDTASWMVTFHPGVLPNLFFIKPAALNANSNIIVTTNRHNYYFHVISHDPVESKASEQTYAVQVEYAAPVKTSEHNKQSQAKNITITPKPLHTNYRFSGSPQLVPLHVFDDGHFTYFELAENAPVPAIFAVEDKQGKENTVNIRRQGKYLVVQRLAPQFTLRHGAMVTSVFNISEIARIQQNRRPQ